LVGGCFFEIDQRLLFVVSFADFLLLFVVFVSVVFVLISAIAGLAVPLLRKCSAWVVERETRMSSILKYLMFAAMIGSNLFAGQWKIYIGVVTGLVIFFMFLVPALSAYKYNEIDRFRVAMIISFFGLSWMVMASGQFVGRVLADGPKRVYLIRLQDKSDVYANIVLYLSNGLIYKVGKEIFYSPNDAVLFTRRTALRREM
jgi:hypothetical protein